MLQQIPEYYCILETTYKIMVTSCALYALAGMGHRSPAGRCFRLILLTGGLTECLGWAGIHRTGSNAWIYVLGSAIAFIFTCAYFWFSTPCYRRYYLMPLCIAAGIIAGYRGSLFLPQVSQAATDYILFLGYTIVILSMGALFLLFTRHDLYLAKQAHFWIALLLLTSWMAILLCYRLLEIFFTAPPWRIAQIVSGILAANILLYGGALLILLRFPKLESYDNRT